MAQLLIMVGDQGSQPGLHKNGDVVSVVDDNHTWGKYESLDAWVKSGAAPADWPALFEIVQIPGEPKEAFDHLLEEGPKRVRSLPDYKTLPTDGKVDSNIRVASPVEIAEISVDRVVKAEAIAADEVIKP